MEGRPLEERDLVEQARSGDAGAYEELVRRYQEVAFRAACLVTRDAHEAEEAAQDAFVKAFYALDRFRPGAPFRSWLLRIVTNEARNRNRSARRRARLGFRLAGARPSGDAAPSPEVTALGHETQRELMDAMTALDERDRVIIAYRYFFEMSEAEMAVALDCPPGTVKSRLSRAMRHLRTHLVAGLARPEPAPDPRPGAQRG
ncbi:MAG TPA: sigma-70 family RNA polymerase sigma factor [Thermomicrobiales bacterium]|nr:sigma-70 family RNA polymerase sigma factor [Thermomicrobiales bacterium]